MRDIKITLLALVLISFSAIAQNKSTEKADKLFKKLKFVDAIEAYNKVIEKGNGDAYVYGQLAEANYQLYNIVEAEKWYAKSLIVNSENSDMIYNYSQVLKANGKLDESNLQMDKFAALKPRDDRSKAYKANNNYLTKLLNAKPDFELQNLSFNSEFSDYGGTVNEGMLYFTSARNTSRKTYKFNNEPTLDVYQVSVSGEGDSETVNGSINSRYHEGLVTFSSDGNTVYFSRESAYENEYEKKEDDKTKYNVQYLYRAKKKDDKWLKVESLIINNNGYSVKDPSLNEDGSVLYFASNMPGGFGMYDLYKVSINEDGTLGEPVNLGNVVNTESDEVSPYISVDNTLYFSSRGHLGIGGLDVFEYNGEKVLNLKQPVNSPADDLAFTINEESGDGYVSSNREGGKGNDDIYKIMRIKPCYTDMLATVVNSETNEAIVGAMVEMKDNDGKVVLSEKTNTKGQVSYRTLCETALNVSAKMHDFESQMLSYTTPQKDVDELQIALKPIDKIIVKDEIVLNPILFDFDKSNITAQGSFELDKLVAVMTKYPDMIIFAKSHTDYIGKDKYNMKLSERRAQSTVQYVVSKGIAKERITGQGFGESEPKVDCGRKCTDEERQINRRSEFKIVSGGPQ